MKTHNCLIRAYVDTLRELRKVRFGAEISGDDRLHDRATKEIQINEELLRQLLPLEIRSQLDSAIAERDTLHAELAKARETEAILGVLVSD